QHGRRAHRGPGKKAHAERCRAERWCRAGLIELGFADLVVIPKARRKTVKDDIVAPEWRLAIREPIAVFDEYTESTVELVPGQINPNEIEGLIVDFRYIAADG